MTQRQAVRILCTDQNHRVLLMRWRDPSNGAFVWEPPGGGLEDGEQPLDTARRELHEETGLSGDAVLDRSVPVRRHASWNGQYYDGEESFFLARFVDPAPIRQDLLQAYEVGWLDSHRWVPWDEIARLPDQVEPPEILSVLAELDPEGPWA